MKDDIATHEEVRARRTERFSKMLLQVTNDLAKTKSLDEALETTRAHPLANASSIFTTSGRAAREFRYRVEASMAGVNIGVAAPMSFFSFGGAKGSFFGDLKAHGREAFDFFTDRKVVISRW